jgi:hypothetical protein
MFTRRLTTTFTAAAVLAGAMIAYGAPANADVPPASPSTVATLLGASNIPAALVVLVDISDSMSVSQHGLYPQVHTELPIFLRALAKQDPQDQTAVIEFGNRNDTQILKPMGPPTPSIPLPADATHDIGTDIGYAFQLALTALGKVPKNIQLGGILLLSDGGLFAPDDLQYDGGNGYNAPGWATLRKQVEGLGIPVIGYALPLTSNPTDIANLNQALLTTFGPQREMLSSNFSNLSSQFETQDVLKSRVAVAAGPDSGQGVKVTWNGPTTAGGKLLFNLPSGGADLSVSLISGTRRVPLRVNDLSIQANGFPADVTATISASDIALKSGQPVKLPVHLSWPPVTGNSAVAQGGRRSWSGNLTLSGHVYSPFTNAIQNFYLDKTFTVGGLTGSFSTGFLATIPGPLNLLLLLLAVLFAVAVIAAVCIIFVRRAGLQGALIITSPSGVSGPPLTLPRWPWFSGRLDDAIKKPGVIRVSGNPFSPAMRIRLRKSTLPDEENTLLPGGQTMISGLVVTHERKVPSRQPERPGPRHEEPGPRPEGPGPRPEGHGPRPEDPGPRPDGPPASVPRADAANPDQWL